MPAFPRLRTDSPSAEWSGYLLLAALARSGLARPRRSGNRRHGKGGGAAVMARERASPGSDCHPSPVGDRGVGTWIPVADGYDERWGPQDEYAEGRVRREQVRRRY